MLRTKRKHFLQRLALGDAPSLSNEQMQACSFLLNEIGSFLSFSGKEGVIEVINAAGEHAVGEMLWQEILRGAPTLCKAEDDANAGVSVTNPSIMTMGLGQRTQARTAAAQSQLSKSEVHNAAAFIQRRGRK